jgi:hypothetical protein
MKRLLVGASTLRQLMCVAAVTAVAVIAMGHLHECAAGETGISSSLIPLFRGIARIVADTARDRKESLVCVRCRDLPYSWYPQPS